jgi:hypothetical protein
MVMTVVPCAATMRTPLTFPARQYVVDRDHRRFAWLRPMTHQWTKTITIGGTPGEARSIADRLLTAASRDQASKRSQITSGGIR